MEESPGNRALPSSSPMPSRRRSNCAAGNRAPGCTGATKILLSNSYLSPEQHASKNTCSFAGWRHKKENHIAVFEVLSGKDLNLQDLHTVDTDNLQEMFISELSKTLRVDQAEGAQCTLWMLSGLQ